MVCIGLEGEEDNLFTAAAGQNTGLAILAHSIVNSCV